MDQSTKPFYLSKTLWVNLLSVGALLIPSVQAYSVIHPTLALDVLSAVNVILRLVSSDKLSIS